MSACRESPIKQWIRLAAVVSAMAACVGRRDDVSSPAGPAPDPPIAAAPGDAWSPSARRPSDADAASATPTDGVSRPESDLSGALGSVTRPRGADDGKSYLIPAFEILGYEVLLNQFDRRFIDEDTYGSDGDSIHDNLHNGWVIDKDPFDMNQFGHPYSGSVFHGFARSAGLDYWEALGYDFVGSALWEVAGETDPPSLNDQITTTFAGSFLGEALFRTADLVRRGGRGEPGAVRSLSAGLISPAAGINRLAFGPRFDASYPRDDPAVYYWLGVGAGRNTRLKDISDVSDIRENAAVAAFSLDYGLPGKPGYAYTRPFDYFHFEGAAGSNEHAVPENVMVRGLLYGADCSCGRDYSAIWGLYGTYDYFSPEVFKVSSTALSLGTTGQYLMSDKFALQGTVLGGIGFTAAGENDEGPGDAEYRYGASPQALLSLRLVYGDVAAFGLTANAYVISDGGGSSGESTADNIARAQLSLTVRVYGRNAIGIQFIETSRDTTFSGIPDPRQSVGALTIFYTFLGDEGFGVVGR